MLAGGHFGILDLPVVHAEPIQLDGSYVVPQGEQVRLSRVVSLQALRGISGAPAVQADIKRQLISDCLVHMRHSVREY
jgi:hypothetical protein